MAPQRQDPSENPSPGRRSSRIHAISVATRIKIAYGLFLLPLILLFLVLLHSSSEEIRVARKEIVGNEYLRVVREIAGQLALPGAVPSAAMGSRIDKAEAHWGGGLGSSGVAKAVRALLTVDAAPGAARVALLRLTQAVADGAGLTLDPEFGSYYVQDLVTTILPPLTDRLASLAERANPDRSQVLLSAGAATQLTTELSKSLDLAVSADAGTRDALQTWGVAAAKEAMQFIGAAQAGDHAPAGPALAVLSSLGDAGADELDRLLKARIDKQLHELEIVLGAVVVLFFIGVAFVMIAVEQGAVVPLGNLSRILRKIGSGEISEPIEGTDWRDEVGDIARAAEAFRDSLTRAQQAQEEAVRLHYAVEMSRLADENRRKEEAVRKAQAEVDRMATLGTLVAGVAHEVNTPVGIGLTAMTALEDQLRTLEAAQNSGGMTRRDLSRFMENAGTAVRLTTENLNRAAALVRSFKSISVDQHVEVPREIDLKDYVQQVAVTLGYEVRSAGHRLLVEGEDGIRLTMAAGLLWQILSNLVLNARNHAFPDRGGGTITIDVRRLAPDKAQIEVTDDGIGMSEGVMQHCFEPFFTTRRGSGGTGLGLSIVYNLTAGLGGRISVRSEPGRGATFSMELPIRG